MVQAAEREREKEKETEAETDGEWKSVTEITEVPDCPTDDVSGLAPIVFHAVYCASKAAVACMSETLRMELKLLGISVSTIIPSGYRTGKWTERFWLSVSPP